MKTLLLVLICGIGILMLNIKLFAKNDVIVCSATEKENVLYEKLGEFKRSKNLTASVVGLEVYLRKGEELRFYNRGEDSGYDPERYYWEFSMKMAHKPDKSYNNSRTSNYVHSYDACTGERAYPPLDSEAEVYEGSEPVILKPTG